MKSSFNNNQKFANKIVVFGEFYIFKNFEENDINVVDLGKIIPINENKTIVYDLYKEAKSIRINNYLNNLFEDDLNEKDFIKLIYEKFINFSVDGISYYKRKTSSN